MGTAASAVWIETQWPAMLAAAQHAHQSVKSGAGKFTVLTPDEAKEVEAIASCILPSDGTAGAKEAGVVYFIDMALGSFAKTALPQYRQGLPELNRMIAEMFPGVKSFSAASAEQQEKVLEVMSDESPVVKQPLRRRPSAVGPDFFQTIWFLTVAGFLVDPEGGGNRDYAGWKVIGRDPAHTFQSPFGYYDKDYPGWKPASGETGKP